MLLFNCLYFCSTKLTHGFLKMSSVFHETLLVTLYVEVV